MTSAARTACGWRGNATGSGGNASVSSSSAHVREFMRLREILLREMNVTASRRTSHAASVRVMKRTIPEGTALVSELTEDDLKTPEEFYLVEFKNPDKRAVVARGKRLVDVAGGASSTRAAEEVSVFTSDDAEVETFLNSPGVRFHRMVHAYTLAGDAFDVGDFTVCVCRAERQSGAYAGTILDLSYRATNDARTATQALREYAAHATSVINASAETDSEKGSFVFTDLAASCPPSVYRAPAGELQTAISYVDALRSLKR